MITHRFPLASTRRFLSSSFRNCDLTVFAILPIHRFTLSFKAEPAEQYPAVRLVVRSPLFTRTAARNGKRDASFRNSSAGKRTEKESVATFFRSTNCIAFSWTRSRQSEIIHKYRKAIWPLVVANRKLLVNPKSDSQTRREGEGGKVA